MNLVGSSFFTVADRPTLPQASTGAGLIIVWLQCEHDANALRTWVEVPAEQHPRTKVPEGTGRLARIGW